MSLWDCQVEHPIKRVFFFGGGGTVYVYVRSVRSERLEANSSPSANTLFTAAGTLAGDCYGKQLKNEQKLREMTIILLTCVPFATVTESYGRLNCKRQIYLHGCRKSLPLNRPDVKVRDSSLLCHMLNKSQRGAGGGIKRQEREADQFTSI